MIDAADSNAQALFRQLKQVSTELLTLVRLSSILPRGSLGISPLLAMRIQSFVVRKEFEEAGILADFMTNIVDSSFEEKLQILAAIDVKSRVQLVLDTLQRQVDGMKGKVKITSFTSTNMPTNLDITNLPQQQRDALLKKGMGNFFGSGNGSGKGNGEDGELDEIQELKQRLDEAGLSAEAKKVADKELKRLAKMNPAQAEYNVARTYLETLAEIPWSKKTEDNLGTDTLTKARKQLDDDHYGLEKIKKRLLEYLAVLRLKQAITVELDVEIKKLEENTSAQIRDDQAKKDDSQIDADLAKIQVLRSKKSVDKSPILLLVGPPGTGKTSLAKSVATALGRKFHRISLGGVRDEAEIRGHRRTYVAAMPGVIVNGLKKVGVSNPVFLLDEIDKVGGANFHGDPSAAMLEVLDPEQNHSFVDHYVNIPLDLSKVLFIATANSLETIPPPLLDRMETIQLSGYTTLEKRHIATRHLIPKQITANALSASDIHIPEQTLDTIITSYTFESGVRNLEREIGSVCRYKAVEYADSRDSKEPKKYNPTVLNEDIETILGIPRYDDELAEKSAVPGIVTGLVAYSNTSQGSILFIEVADMPGSGRVQLTGKLGDVLKESVEVALTWVKAHAFDLGLTQSHETDIMANRSIHVHCPAGAMPKDGPSAGLAHTVALVSLFSGRIVEPSLAMTGEVSLRGRVLPVGGIKEKLIGALRAGVKTVLVPKGNRKDTMDLPEEVKKGLEIVYIDNIWQALRRIWPTVDWVVDSMIESRL